jgi:hypothetical protein
MRYICSLDVKSIEMTAGGLQFRIRSVLHHVRTACRSKPTSGCCRLPKQHFLAERRVPLRQFIISIARLLVKAERSPAM